MSSAIGGRRPHDPSEPLEATHVAARAAEGIEERLMLGIAHPVGILATYIYDLPATAQTAIQPGTGEPSAALPWILAAAASVAALFLMYRMLIVGARRRSQS